MREYKIGVGVFGVPLEWYRVMARNMSEARSIGIRKFLDPDKGYDHIEVRPVKFQRYHKVTVRADGSTDHSVVLVKN